MQSTRQITYEATDHNQNPRGRERLTPNGIKRGPLIFMSLGTCLMIVWLVMLLPGQDIATWQHQQQLMQAANLAAEPAICLPHLRPTTRLIVPYGIRFSFYHWRADCPVLAPREQNRHMRLTTMTFAQAQRQRLTPCTFCSRLDRGEATIIP